MSYKLKKYNGRMIEEGTMDKNRMKSFVEESVGKLSRIINRRGNETP